MGLWWMMVMVVVLLWSDCGWCGIIGEDETATTIYEVEAVQGGTAKLPCNITPELPGDKMGIVIWFKDGDHSKNPIYTFDSRDRLLEQGVHWANDKVLGGRAFFRFQDEPAKLALDNVKEVDGGVYICRVDFKLRPTRNIKVNLTVIIPPEQLSVLGEKGLHIKNYILGPYNEGDSVNITCVASGGRPPPRVTWWQENALLDDSFERINERKVKNVFVLDRVQRSHLHTVFTCQASNNNLVAPISSSVTLDINLRPLWVKITSEKKPLSADNPYELSCEVVGSRPEPVITWWLGSVQLKDTRETTSPDGNVTTSILTFTPTINDGGKHLSCRGVQPLIQDSGKEDGWTLVIHHVPLVSLELGINLNGSTIKEGVDVYFECNIKSNPWVYKVSWRHNGKQLYNNQAAGIVVTNQSLVLQSITRARAGLYTCVGHNQEGDGESNPVQLDVKFAPVCKLGQTKVFGVARGEVARITCELEANPTDVSFVWRFNNSNDDVFDIAQNHFNVDRARSTVTYKPMSEVDYGTLLCYGRNEIGAQQEPCVYYINPAGKPDPLSNCTILNQTAESLHVECIEGFDGGLRQDFVMEIYDTQTRKLVSNVTSRSPVFIVGGLESGLGFDIGLYATNKKGKSDIVHLQAFTLKSAEKHTASLVRNKPQPPQNCTVTHQTETYITVHCLEPQFNDDPPPTYFLQVYDATTRMLLGSATSDSPELTFYTAPKHHNGLQLFVRSMNSKSMTSDAAVILTPPADLRIRKGATTPVLLHITPILGTLIGVVAALIFVAIIIVVVIRLRGGGERDDKDYDDGGLSSTHRRSVGLSDKASTEPLNKDLNGSIDSLEEKNPDVIPQKNGEDEYQEEERAFERLNNATLGVYTRVQSPSNKNGNYDCFPTRTTDELTYAELSFANQQMPLPPPHPLYNQQSIPMSVIRRQEPTVYAQLDMVKQRVGLQPLSPPLPSTFLHHPTFLPRPIREEQGGVAPDTPIMNVRDNSVLQPLLEAGSTRTPTITSTQPRTVTATRF